MKNWYYRLWVDAITSRKKANKQQGNWKVFTLVPVSLFQGINLFTIFYWLKRLVNHNLLLSMLVDIFKARLINDFISVLITFFIPFAILNYLLIFSNDRYEKLIQTYRGENGAFYKKYILFSLGLLIIPLLADIMFF
ncbi:MAG TPA: hypothetical protein VHA56_07585 [Mucilaginibacter sp.]|nr:hypothetical protein [Mucilaginibacter sp.]